MQSKYFGRWADKLSHAVQTFCLTAEEISVNFNRILLSIQKDLSQPSDTILYGRPSVLFNPDQPFPWWLILQILPEAACRIYVDNIQDWVVPVFKLPS